MLHLSREPLIFCNWITRPKHRPRYWFSFANFPRRNYMKQHRFTSSFLCALVLASGASGIRMLAQLPANATVYASGLEGPRGLAFGSDGTLYVAEAGLAGNNTTVGQCEQSPAPIGPYMG